MLSHPIVTAVAALLAAAARTAAQPLWTGTGGDWTQSKQGQVVGPTPTSFSNPTLWVQPTNGISVVAVTLPSPNLINIVSDTTSIDVCATSICSMSLALNASGGDRTQTVIDFGYYATYQFGVPSVLAGVDGGVVVGGRGYQFDNGTYVSILYGANVTTTTTLWNITFPDGLWGDVAASTQSAPAAVANALYALFTTANGTTLYCIRATTGDILWTLPVDASATSTATAAAASPTSHSGGIWTLAGRSSNSESSAAHSNNTTPVPFTASSAAITPSLITITLDGIGNATLKDQAQSTVTVIDLLPSPPVVRWKINATTFVGPFSSGASKLMYMQGPSPSDQIFIAANATGLTVVTLLSMATVRFPIDDALSTTDRLGLAADVFGAARTGNGYIYVWTTLASGGPLVYCLTPNDAIWAGRYDFNMTTDYVKWGNVIVVDHTGLTVYVSLLGPLIPGLDAVTKDAGESDSMRARRLQGGSIYLAALTFNPATSSFSDVSITPLAKDLQAGFPQLALGPKPGQLTVASSNAVGVYGRTQ